MRLKRTKTPKSQVLWLWTLQAAEIRGWFKDDYKHLPWLIFSRYRNKINVLFWLFYLMPISKSTGIVVHDSNDVLLSSEMNDDVVPLNAILEVGRAMRA